MKSTTQSLKEIWKRLAHAGYETDKFSVHSYGDIYEEILAPYREVATHVLEVGLFAGNSMRLWEAYFTKAEIHGIDCHEQPHGGLADLRPMIAEGTHHIHILDATNEYQVHKEFRGMSFQVIWDDGNHNISSQLESYRILSKYLADGGLYVIEDLDNIDQTREAFQNIDATKKVEIIDLRPVKGRFDDCLLIIKDK